MHTKDRERSMKPSLVTASSRNDAPGYAVLSILIPVYNEVDLLPATLARVLAAPSSGLRKEVVIVDDGSTDGTREYLRSLQPQWQTELRRVAARIGISLAPELLDLATVRVHFHPRNRGKGAAIRTAIEASTGDICLVQDADLEYDASDYARLLQPILEGRADVVYGSRFLGDGSRRGLYFWHTLGNQLLTLASNLLTDLNLTDMETGYKVFRSDVLKSVHLTCDRFGFEPEVTAKLAKLGARIYEVPISYHGRTYEEGKKIGWRDAVAALWHIARFNLLPGTYCRDAGHETLRNLGAVRRFNRHMYDTIAPYLGSRVLEAGSGIGNITAHLARRRSVVATDVDAVHLQQLRDRFRDYASVEVAAWDASKPFDGASPDEKQVPGAGGGPPHVRQFDSVVCLNVLEHIEADLTAVEQMRECLAPDGRLVLLVPAHPRLFCALDEEVGHYRRYPKEELTALLHKAGFEIERLVPFNVWGLFGWWLNGCVLHRKRLPGGQLSLFGRLSGLLIWLERRVGPPIGLSYIAIARAGAGVGAVQRPVEQLVLASVA